VIGSPRRSADVAMFVHVLDDRAVSHVATTIARAVAARGADVVIVAGSSTASGRDRLGGLPLVDLGGETERKTSRVVPALARWLRRSRPAVLFAHGEGPGRAAIVARLVARAPTQVVVVEHAHATTFRKAGRARNAVTRLLYPRAALVAGVAPAVVDDMARRAPGIGGRRAVLPSIGPDPARLPARVAGAPGHPWLDGPARPFVIVSVANVVPRKGQDVLVRALPAVRDALGDARLLLVGRVDDEAFAAHLRRLADARGVGEHVCLAGYVAEPLPLVARSDVAALGSRSEGLPMALLEAMACGVPVVATDCPAGVSYLLEGGEAGLLVPVDDHGAMADAIIRIGRDAELRARIVARGRERAAAFSPDVVAQQYLAVARQVGPPHLAG
jgi:glycosyltransferase involved in cell wall biosynthesis